MAQTGALLSMIAVRNAPIMLTAVKSRMVATTERPVVAASSVQPWAVRGHSGLTRIREMTPTTTVAVLVR